MCDTTYNKTNANTAILVPPQGARLQRHLDTVPLFPTSCLFNVFGRSESELNEKRAHVRVSVCELISCRINHNFHLINLSVDLLLRFARPRIRVYYICKQQPNLTHSSQNISICYARNNKLFNYYCSIQGRRKEILVGNCLMVFYFHLFVRT